MSKRRIAYFACESLGNLLDRRANAIEEAMVGLPQALWPDDGRPGGLTLYKDSQVVYELPCR